MSEETIIQTEEIDNTVSETTATEATETEEGKKQETINDNEESANPEADGSLLSDAKTENETESADAKAEETPDRYEFDLPQGYELDDDIVEQVSPLLKELGASKEQAQKFADIAMNMVSKQRAADINHYKATKNEWENSLKSDAEFGGAKFRENLGYAARAIDKFAGTEAKELRQVLAETGLGSYPPLVKLMIRAGKFSSEDHFVKSSATQPTVKEQVTQLAHKLFDKSL